MEPGPRPSRAWLQRMPCFRRRPPVGSRCKLLTPLARGPCGRLFVRERRDQPGGSLRLVDWNERVAVLDPLEASVRERLRQALGVAELEEAILGCPREQHGLVELAQSLGGLERVPGADAAEDRGELAADAPVGQ